MRKEDGMFSNVKRLHVNSCAMTFSFDVTNMYCYLNSLRFRTYKRKHKYMKMLLYSLFISNFMNSIIYLSIYSHSFKLVIQLV